MKRHWLSLVLWTAFLFLLGLGDSHVLKRAGELPGDPPSFVYRGDMRIPDEIRKAGGFFPRDPKVSLGRKLTTVEVEQSSSLYFHHGGSTSKYTKYVSTTTEPGVAQKFATPFRGAQQGVEETGYIYRISTDAKFVDVAKSLGPENMIKEFVPQAEHAAVGGIPFDQIEGWYKVADIGPEELAKLEQGEKLEHLFTANDKFDPKYTPLRGSGAQHQLAGFGKSGKGVKARTKQPWKQYKGDSVEKHLEEFRLKVAGDVKAPEGAEAAEGADVFVEADALGARDLIGALDVGEVREGLASVEITEASLEAETVEITAELEAAEVAEAAEAVEAAEILEAAELVEVGEGASVIAEVLAFLLI